MSSVAAARPETSAAPAKVLRVLWSLNRGGAEVRAVDVVRALDREQVAVDFVALCGKPSELDETVRELGSQVHYLPMDRKFVFRFWNLLRRERPTCVHCQLTLFSGIVMLMAWLAGVPKRMASYHNMRCLEKKSFIGRIYSGTMKWLVKRFATNVVAVSEGTLDACVPNWRSDSRCQVVYQGFPQKTSTAREQQAVREELGLDSSPIIINVGNFRTIKNQIRTLQIFAEMYQEFQAGHLLFAGGTHGYAESESNFAEIQKVIKNLGLESCVHLLGNRQDVSTLMAVSDLMLFTSVSEGCANVIWEAISQGTPVLTSELPIVDELSTYMPGVVQCSLEEDNDVWVKKLHVLRLQSKDTAFRQELKSRFAAGPLNVTQSSRIYQELWTGQAPAESVLRKAA